MALPVGQARTEVLILVHGELRVYLLHYLQSNGYNDKNRGASDSKRRDTGGPLDYVRQNSDEAKKYRPHQSHAVQQMVQELGGHRSGTDTRDVSALLLDVFGY